MYITAFVTTTGKEGRQTVKMGANWGETDWQVEERRVGVWGCSTLLTLESGVEGTNSTKPSSLLVGSTFVQRE